MRTDTKVLYRIRKYGLENSCLCRKCGSEVLKSNLKSYDYYCPKCQQALFEDEVDISNIKKTEKDKQEVIKNLSAKV